MFLSMVSAPGDDHRIGTLSDATAEKRFNVAASRAKEQMWLFHSATLNDLHPQCLRYRLLDYCRNPSLEQTDVSGINIDQLRAVATIPGRNSNKPPQPFDSWFEVDVFLRIVDRGYRVIPQYKVAGYHIDLVVEGMQGCLAVECDGDEWHGPERYESDMARQRQLERSGYVFWRIRGSAFYRAPEEAMNSLWTLLDQMRIFSGASDQPAALDFLSDDNDIEETREVDDCCEILETEADADEVVELEPLPTAVVSHTSSITSKVSGNGRKGKKITQSDSTGAVPNKPNPGFLRVVFRRMSSGEIYALFPEIPASNNPDECLSYTRKNGYRPISYAEAVQQSTAAKPREYGRLFKELSEEGYDLIITHRAKQHVHEQRQGALWKSLQNQSGSNQSSTTIHQDCEPADYGHSGQHQLELMPDSNNAGQPSSARKILVDGNPATVVHEERWDGRTLLYVYLDGDDEIRKFYSPPTEVVDLDN